MEFEFPDTGEGVTEGKFLEWLVEEGEDIEEDQVVGEAETDKAVVDIPSPTTGAVKELKVAPGDKVEVGQVIMEIDDQKSGKDNSEADKVQQKTMEDTKEKNTSESVKHNSVLALPKVRKKADEKGVNLSDIKPSGRITEEDLEKYLSKDQEKNSTSEIKSQNVNASPSVRKLAREQGIDIQKVEGTGRDGKITRDDILNYTETEDDTKVKADVGDDIIDQGRVRQQIADKMEESRFTAPHVTHVEKADVTELVELRQDKKEKVDVHLTYLPFIMKSVLIALQDFPRFRGELDEEKNQVKISQDFDFNIAVDTDRGLMVPLIEKVDEKNILELAGDISEKAEKARNNQLEASELRNGCFSITNIGVIGGEEFTPIIYHPQVAILGIGKISETAEVVDGEIKPRNTVKLSLSYDHRVVDGADAARFMNRIVENLEDPQEMLMEL